MREYHEHDMKANMVYALQRSCKKLKKPCQPGYEQYGMKIKDGKKS